MKEMKFFKNHLSPQQMREFDYFLTCPGGMFDQPCESTFRLVYPDQFVRNFTTCAEFLAGYHPSLATCYERHLNGTSVIVVNFQGSSPESRLIVKAPDQRTINLVFKVMEKLLGESALREQRGCRKPWRCIRKPAISR